MTQIINPSPYQTDADVEAAYNNQVAQISAGERTAGTETGVRRVSPFDIKDMIDTHAPSGGGISFYDAEVGSGETYTTLKAAVDASKSRILVKSNTTETANIAVPSGGLVITILDGADIDMQGNKFTYAAAADVYINGFSDSKITASNGTASQYLFSNESFNTSKLVISNIRFDFTGSTAAGTFADGVQQIDGCSFEFDNSAGGGYKIFLDDDISGNTNPFIRNTELDGGESSCSDVIHVQKGLVNDIIFTGADYSNSTYAATFELEAKVDGIRTKFPTTESVIIRVGSIPMSNVYAGDGDHITIDVSLGDDFKPFSLVNAELGGFGDITNISRYCTFTNVACADIDLSTGLVDEVQISNCRFTDSVTIADDDIQITNTVFDDSITISGNSVKLSNFTVTSTISITGSDNHLSNGRSVGSITISSGDDNGLSNLRVGFGGGSNTINISSSSVDRTRIVGCATDATISDSGTGTVTAANTVF